MRSREEIRKDILDLLENGWTLQLFVDTCRTDIDTLYCRKLSAEDSKSSLFENPKYWEREYQLAKEKLSVAIELSKESKDAK